MTEQEKIAEALNAERKAIAELCRNFRWYDYENVSPDEAHLKLAELIEARRTDR